MDATDVNSEVGVHTSESLEGTLERLMAKVEKIERAVDRLDGVIDQTPAMIHMTTDTFDHLYGELQASGINPEARAQQGLQLLVRLTEPETARSLERLLDKVEGLASAADELPGMVAFAANSVDETMAAAARAGIDVETRARASLVLLERLTDPQTIDVLAKLLDNTDALQTVLDEGPGMVAMAVDTLDGMYAAALQHGIDFESLTRDGIEAMGRLTDLLQSEEFQSIVNSGMLDKETVRVLGHAAKALADSREDIQPVGPLGALRALSDPEVQKAVGFATAFAKHFGSNLSNSGR